MSKSHPVLGYPSKTAAVLASLKQGLSVRAIADRIGIEEKSVMALETSSRRAKRTEERTVVFPLETLDRLRPHATRRGISANELARRIVETAADEQMINAILDDGEAA